MLSKLAPEDKRKDKDGDKCWREAKFDVKAALIATALAFCSAVSQTPLMRPHQSQCSTNCGVRPPPRLWRKQTFPRSPSSMRGDREHPRLLST